MNVDPRLLNLVASTLIVVVVARVATHQVRADLWAFGVYALGAGAAAIVLLLALGVEFEVGVFLFGIAAVTGAYWTALSRPHEPLTLQSHAVSLAAALGLVTLLTLVAVAYRWWVAPLTLLLLMGIGLVVNGIVPLLRGRGVPGSAVPSPAAPTPRTASGASSIGLARPAARALRPTADGSSPPSRPVAPGASAPAAKVALLCLACGLQGAVSSTLAGKTLACPRCQSPVKVPLSAGPDASVAGKVPAKASGTPAGSATKAPPASSSGPAPGARPPPRRP